MTVKFWVVTVDDERQQQQIDLNGYTVSKNRLEDATVLVYSSRDLLRVATILAEKYPGREVFICSPTESLYSKPAAVTRKKIDTATGEMVPV